MLKDIEKRGLLDGLGLWLRWILVAWPAGLLTTGWMAVGLSFRRLVTGVGGEAALAVLLVYLAGGLLFAPLAAFLQLLVARRGLQRARSWMWTTVGGWMCFFVAAPFLSAALGRAPSAKSLSTALVAAAVVIAFLQWLQLRRQLDRAYYWIAGAAGSWSIAAWAFATVSSDSDLSPYAAVGTAVLLAPMLTGIAVVFLFRPAGNRIAPTAAAACVSVVLIMAGWLYVGGRYRQQITTRWGHETPVNSVAFSPDGRFIASASSGLLSTPRDSTATARLWVVSSGTHIRPGDAKIIELPAPAAYPNDFRSLVFAQQGSVLAADVQEGALTLWDMMTSEQILHLHVTTENRRVSALGFARDDPVMAVPGANSSLKLFDVGSGAGLMVLAPAQQRTQVDAIAFSPAGDLVAAAYYAGEATKVFVWDVPTGRELRTFTGPRRPVRLSFSPDGSLLAIGTEFPGAFALNDRLPAADGSFPARPAGNTKDAALVWDVKTGQTRYAIKGPGVTALAFSPDGAVLALARSYGNGILLWSLAEGRELAVLRGGRDLQSIAYSPDGRLIVTGSSDGAIRLWAAPPVPGRD